MLFSLFTALALVSSALSHGDHEHQTPISGPHKSLWYNSLPGDGGTQVFQNIPVSAKLQLTILQADSVFSGISTFGRLPYFPCLASDDEKFDIAFLGSRSCPTLLRHMTDLDLIGAPFDIGTSYRPGARFGPSGIRQGSRRLNL